MRIPLAATVLLATVVTNFGAPLNSIPQKNHRESTKEILDLEQELKKAAGEDKKPRLDPQVPVPAGAIADEELVKELAEHEESSADPHPPPGDQDSAEDELQKEKEVAEKAAQLKAAQEEAEEKDGEADGDEEDEKEQLKDADKSDSVQDEEKSEEVLGQEEVGAKQEEQDPLEGEPDEEQEEEELQSLPVPSNINDLYEDYLNEQRQAYYDAKRSYGDALDNLAKQDSSKDMFVASLLETIREHPELLDEMRTEPEEEVRPEYGYNAARNDREEALRAEYLAATRGLAEPAQFDSYEANPYQSRLYEPNEVRPQMENYQNYPSDKMAKVVAKKWGYAPPEEYYDVKDNAEVAAPPMVASDKDKKKQQEDILDQPQHMEPVM